MQQIAVRAVQFETVDAEPLGAFGGRAKASRMRASPCASSASGGASPSLCGTAEGPSACQPPSDERDLLAAVPWRMARPLRPA